MDREDLRVRDRISLDLSSSAAKITGNPASERGSKP